MLIPDTNNGALLVRAIEVATAAHKGQLDKLGEQYILHPLAVMLMQKDHITMMVAVLHDVVEDTAGKPNEVTLDDLRKEFPAIVVEAVDAISKRPNELNKDYMDRVAANRVATVVKLADMQHNAGRLYGIKNEKEKAYLQTKYTQQTLFLRRKLYQF